MTFPDNEIPVLVKNPQWALIRENDKKLGDLAGQSVRELSLFFVWVADEECPITMMAACQRLNDDPPEWPGVALAFHTQPSPGFTVHIREGWEPVSAEEEQILFDKMIWEIERARRKS